MLIMMLLLKQKVYLILYFLRLTGHYSSQHLSYTSLEVFYFTLIQDIRDVLTPQKLLCLICLLLFFLEESVLRLHEAVRLGKLHWRLRRRAELRGVLRRREAAWFRHRNRSGHGIRKRHRRRSRYRRRPRLPGSPRDRRRRRACARDGPGRWKNWKFGKCFKCIKPPILIWKYNYLKSFVHIVWKKLFIQYWNHNFEGLDFSDGLIYKKKKKCFESICFDLGVVWTSRFRHQKALRISYKVHQRRGPYDSWIEKDIASKQTNKNVLSPLKKCDYNWKVEPWCMVNLRQ